MGMLETIGSYTKLTSQVKLQKHAKGSRPYYFDEPAVDRLLAMILALASEVSVSRDRQDTLERLISDKGLLSQNEIEDFQPTKEILAERDARREHYLGQILRIVDIDAADMGRNDVSPAWEKVINSVTETN